MGKPRIHVGLEIGTTKTVLVAAEVKPDGSVKILGLGETSSAGVRKGEIVDYPQVRACVKAALLKAEDISDVDIGSVFLAVTGSHIQGLNNRGTYRLPEGEPEIRPRHVEEVKEIASDIAIHSEHVYIHSVIRHYTVDGQPHATMPIGLLGKTLDAEFHIVHGIRTRVQNSMKCVREIPLDVDDVVFAPIASAQVVLERRWKDAGALVLDIGGGTTDYVLYVDGAILASGCIPVGGDHVTNDIHLVTHIPLSKAEQVKKTEGDASGDPSRAEGVVIVPDEGGFPEVEIKRQILNDVIRMRFQEMLELVKERLPPESLVRVGKGVFLTGGSSQMNGLGELAQDVFGLPVRRPESPDVSGVHAYFKDPQYSTALGLIRYAQILEEERPNSSSFRKVGGFLRSLWPFDR